MSIVNMTLKEEVTTLKYVIEMSEMTLNDSKFDLKSLLDTLD